MTFIYKKNDMKNTSLRAIQNVHIQRASGHEIRSSNSSTLHILVRQALQKPVKGRTRRFPLTK